MSDNKNIIKLCVAGGGKTTKIIQYINDLKEDKSRILLISFSNTTAQDLERKLGIKAYTLHSFCTGYGNNNNHIIENYNYLIDFLKIKYTTLRYISNTQINNWIFQYQLHNIMNTISDDNISNISIRDQQLNREFGLLMKDIEQNIYNQRSFLDILKDFWKDIDNILPLIYNKFDYILIDEAQDLSSLQLKIIYKMIDEIFTHDNKGFIIVGDPQQIIYGFQGALVSDYNDFIHKIEGLCKKRGLKLTYDKYNVTYRFGGEILQHINTLYPMHNSTIAIGKYYNLQTKELSELIRIINEKITEYKEENVLVLFNRNSSLIEALQKDLNNGANIRIYLYNHLIYKHLQNIYYYLTTYGNANKDISFKNSIFMNLDIRKIRSYMFNNIQMFQYLTNIIVLNTHIDILLWQEICRISQQYTSFTAFFLCIPENITISSKGIRFMTVHSSKGLEADCVIYINEIFSNSKINMINGILIRDNLFNSYTSSLYRLYIKEQTEQLRNVQYVALTRAKKELIEINV